MNIKEISTEFNQVLQFPTALKISSRGHKSFFNYLSRFYLKSYLSFNVWAQSLELRRKPFHISPSLSPLSSAAAFSKELGLLCVQTQQQLQQTRANPEVWCVEVHSWREALEGSKHLGHWWPLQLFRRSPQSNPACFCCQVHSGFLLSLKPTANISDTSLSDCFCFTLFCMIFQISK